ncbi:MAG TPA: DUF3060 domain-containing protein [Pyrinomonadaceae bacterium]|nr:DUF3060 domain-containing protein [Pyrinomonadaceae bacterium]
MKSKLLIFFIGGLICTACNYQSPDVKPAENAANSGTQTSQSSKNQSNQADKNAAATNSNQENGGNDGEKLILTGTSQSASYPCNGREVEIDADTTTGKYTFTGECKKLTVDGVASTVRVEKVGEIVVKGVSNKVIYGEGIGGRKPKITKSGPSTSVESKAEAEKREADAAKKQQANK